MGPVCLAEVEHFGVWNSTESMQWEHRFSIVEMSYDSGTFVSFDLGTSVNDDASALLLFRRQTGWTSLTWWNGQSVSNVNLLYCRNRMIFCRNKVQLPSLAPRWPLVSQDRTSRSSFDEDPSIVSISSTRTFSFCNL